MSIKILHSGWESWCGLSRAARLLVINALAFNLGFYMMMPYLAHHLGSGLELAGWAVGLVMGMRVFSQQGLFLLGGTLGDRMGYRAAIIGGCLIRSGGFALLGWAEQLPVLLLAAFLTGFAGALFTPCAQAYLAEECPHPAQRQQAFALHNLASEAGMLLGPLLGLWLTHCSYALTGWVSGGVFLLLTGLQWRYLPPHRAAVSPPRERIWQQWRTILRNRAFLCFTIFSAAYGVLFHQLYLSIPAYIHSQQQTATLLGSVFTVTALIGVLLQLPASLWVQRSLGVARGMGLGLACMGCSYLLISWLAMWPVLAVLSQAVLFSLGSILCYPLFSARLPHYAVPGLLASHYGFYASVGGVVALLSNVLIGLCLGASGTTPPAWIWYLLATCGLVAGCALYRQVGREIAEVQPQQRSPA